MRCTALSTCRGFVTRRINSPATAPPSLAAARPLVLTLRAQQKGFGGESQQQQQRSGGGQKVSKRGKLASRPSPERQLQELQAQDAAFRAALAAKEEQQQQQQPAAQQQQPMRSADPVPESSSAEAIPQAVSDRMLRRIVVCAGAPVFLGLTLFPLFYWIKARACEHWCCIAAA